jgi:MoaA/NifB/PqqE/SkfB family radical SAM enzyme
MIGVKKIRRKITAFGRLFGTRRFTPRLGPQRVFLQPTHVCNLACEFCESHSKHVNIPVTSKLQYFRNQRTMDRETAMTIVRELAELGVEHVSLTGRGEPTTHRNILEIIEAIQRHGMKTQLVTNGIVSRCGIAKDLVRMGCYCVSTSVNAASEETFRNMCGKDGLTNGYEMVVSFIRDLIEAKATAGSSLPIIEVSHVIYANNYKDLPAMIDQWCNENIDYLGFNMIGTVDDTEFLKLDPDARRWILQASGNWAAQLSAARVRSNMQEFLRVVRKEERSISKEDNLQRRLPCYAGWLESAIGPDGAVRGCCYCDAVLGNVHTDGGFKGVWQNHAYQKIRAESKRMHLSGKPICEECFTTCNRGQDNLRIHNRLHPFTLRSQR